MQQTILSLLNPLIALLFATTFFALWLRDRQSKYVLAFAASYALLGAGFLWSQFVPFPQARIYFNLTNVPYFCATLLALWAFGQRCKRKVSMPLAFTIGGVMTVMFALAHQFTAVSNVDIYIASSAFGMLYFMAAQVTAGKRHDSLPDLLIFWLLCFTCLQFFVRPSLIFMMEGTLTPDTYRDSIYYSILNTFIALNASALAISIIAACVLDSIRREQDASDRDPLTGLLNRRAFERSVAVQSERAAAKGVPLALVVGDIDHFKQVNDLFGHPVGDKAIAAFGKLIRRTVRDYDVAGRIGGEEFCVLVWNADETIAAKLAERLRLGVSCIQIDEMGKDLRLSASFGATGMSAGESYHSLYSRADNALYRAKESGRNRVARADGQDEAGERRQAPEADGSKPNVPQSRVA